MYLSLFISFSYSVLYKFYSNNSTDIELTVYVSLARTKNKVHAYSQKCKYIFLITEYLLTFMTTQEQFLFIRRLEIFDKLIHNTIISFLFIRKINTQLQRSESWEEMCINSITNSEVLLSDAFRLKQNKETTKKTTLTIHTNVIFKTHCLLWQGNIHMKWLSMKVAYMCIFHWLTWNWIQTYK